MTEYYQKIKDQEERIVCSAIWVKDETKMTQPPFNVKSGYVAYGLRHGNCYEVIAEKYGFTANKEYPASYHAVEKVQGFLTSKNRFVDRIEGAEIAFKANQTEILLERLHSEDLY